ncbi:MAG: PHP domain-containing protein, partial [Deltaproteobacteria bacterium]|nr:PHP domain-containing protein [Deltaproteobacteria bacterium]
MSDKNNSFVHLHVHTEFSFLDGANRIDILVEHAKSAGFSALAITDHGNMCGVMDFYKAAIASGIKPIVGCEIYVEGTENQNHHLTVLVRDEVGWRNLSVMSSKSFKENFYYKPRIKKEWLKEMHEGLIVLSGCVASEVGELVSKEMFDEADSVLEFYRKIFGERFFLELQPHNIPEQIKLNDYLIDRAELLGLPLVVTNDVHYPTKDYHFSQEVLMCISLRKTIDDPTRITHPGLNLHLKTEEEIRQELIGYACLDEAIKNTAEIAKSVVFEFRPRKPSMPRLSLKEEPCELLSRKAKEGFQNKVLGVVSNEVLPEYQRRLDFELEEIRKMGFCEYFLVVEDFISWAKNQKISVGPGRGSVAGSLVA